MWRRAGSLDGTQSGLLAQTRKSSPYPYHIKFNHKTGENWLGYLLGDWLGITPLEVSNSILHKLLGLFLLLLYSLWWGGGAFCFLFLLTYSVPTSTCEVSQFFFCCCSFPKERRKSMWGRAVNEHLHGALLSTGSKHNMKLSICSYGETGNVMTSLSWNKKSVSDSISVLK